MPIENVTVYRLADLRFGDRIKSWDGNKYDPPRLVIGELGLIEAGSPVRGVRLENPRPENGLELVLYPGQMDGHRLEVDRYVP